MGVRQLAHRSKARKWWLLAAVAAGVVLRVGFILHIARITGDSLVYGDFARNLLQHGVYGFTVSDGPPRPSLIRVPGYPLFLAACFRVFGIDHYQPVLYVQLVVDLLTCVVVSALAGRLFGRRAAMLTLWLAMLCPFTASYVAAPLTETLTLFTIAVAFYALERWQSARMNLDRWAITIAASLAYSILLRPEQGLLAAAVVSAMAAFVWQQGSRTPQPEPSGRSGRRLSPFIPVAIVAACVVLPLVPWTIRNWRTFHVLQPLAPRYANDPGELVPLGFQRWYRTWAIDFASTEAVYWNYDSDAIEVYDLPTRAFDSERQYRDTAALLSEYNQKMQATAPLDRRFETLARQRIAADPIRYYVALPVARLLNMLFRPRMEMFEVPLEWWKQPRPRPGHAHVFTRAFAFAYGALNLVFFALGGWGLRTWHRTGFGAQRPLVWAMAGYAILRCLLLLTVDNSEPRYTVELFIPLLIWAGALALPGALPGPRNGSADTASIRP